MSTPHSPSAIVSHRFGLDEAWLLVLAAGIVMGLTLGARHVQGLFLLPITEARGWSRELFGFAMAVQNLTWGLTQAFAGMIADRYGAGRVVAAGLVLYAVGLGLMTVATTPIGFVASAGLCIGLALSGTTFGVIYAALSRRMPLERRGWALGLAGAIGGAGQFVMVPLMQWAIAALRWDGALVATTAAAIVLLPLAWLLREASAPGANPGLAGEAPMSMRRAVAEAFRHRGFWLLNLGFFACGFQLAFIATHLPAYLLDRGMGPLQGVAALALIALANIGGIYACGVLGERLRRKYLLSTVYLVRAAVMALFVLLPLSTLTVAVFAIVMGLTWLGTVPLTNGVLAQVFGVRHLGTLFGFVFVGHQLGSFLGVWLGGRIFDATGSYMPIWIGGIVIGVIAALLHWPIDDRPLLRSDAVAAPA